MKRGKVWLVELPKIDGRETFGYRPATVLADPSATIAIIAPLTSNLAATRFSYSRRIDPARGNGLDVPSVLMLEQLRVIDKGRITIKLLTEGQVEISRHPTSSQPSVGSELYGAAAWHGRCD